MAILAHPTARRLGRRGRVDADWDAIFAKAAVRGVAVEANGSPERLDLDGGLLRRAHALGCRVVVSTDAHSVRELDNLRWGVDQARRGWLTAADVVNTLPLGELLRWLRPKRGARRLNKMYAGIPSTSTRTPSSDSTGFATSVLPMSSRQAPMKSTGTIG